MSRLFFEASRPTFGVILRSVKIVDFCQKYGVRKGRDMWWLKNRRDMLFFDRILYVRLLFGKRYYFCFTEGEQLHENI